MNPECSTCGRMAWACICPPVYVTLPTKGMLDDWRARHARRHERTKTMNGKPDSAPEGAMLTPDYGWMLQHIGTHADASVSIEFCAGKWGAAANGGTIEWTPNMGAVIEWALNAVCPVASRDDCPRHRPKVRGVALDNAQRGDVIEFRPLDGGA